MELALQSVTSNQDMQQVNSLFVHYQLSFCQQHIIVIILVTWAGKVESLMAAVTKVTRYYHHYYHHHNLRHYYPNNLKINSGTGAISTRMPSLTSRILDKRISSM